MKRGTSLASVVPRGSLIFFRSAFETPGWDLHSEPCLVCVVGEGGGLDG